MSRSSAEILGKMADMSPPLGIVPVPPVAPPPPPPPSLAKKGPPGKKMQFRSAKWQETADSKYKKVSDEYSLPAPPKALPPPPGPSLAKKGPPGRKMQQRSAKWAQISAKKWQKISPEYSLPSPPELPPPGWKPTPKPQKVVVKRQVSQKIRDVGEMVSPAPGAHVPPPAEPTPEVETSKVPTSSGGRFHSLFSKIKGSKKKSEKQVTHTAGTAVDVTGATSGTSIFSKFKRSKAKVKGQGGDETGVGINGTLSSKNSTQVNSIPQSVSSGDSGFNDEFSAL